MEPYHWSFHSVGVCRRRGGRACARSVRPGCTPYLHGALMRQVDPLMTRVNDFGVPIGEMMAAVCGARRAKPWIVRQQHVHMIADATVGRNRQTVPDKVD